MRRQSLRLRATILQYLSILLVIALAVITIVSMSKGSGSQKAMSEIEPHVTPLFKNDRSEKSTDRMLKKYYGINASDLEASVLYFPITNMDAQELLLVKLKDTSQADSVRNAMEERQKTQIGIYEGYAPEQLSLCENAVLDVQGNYILYVVHENADAIDAAFRQALR